MTDPALLVRPRPVTVTVAGRAVQLRAATAAEWIDALASPAFTETVFARMADPEAMKPVYLSMAVGKTTLMDMQRAAREAVTAAAGLPWWKTARLVGWATYGAPADLWGLLVLRGVDAERMTIAAWCSAVWAIVVENRDAAGKERMRFNLALPPEGEVDMSDWTMDPSEVPRT